MIQIQISILYELIVFVYNFHLQEIVKLRKTAKKSANLPNLRGKLAADDSPLLQNFNFEFWKLATQHLVRNPHDNMPLKISDN